MAMFEKMTRKAVGCKVRYTGGDMIDITHGHVYRCIAEWYDESGTLDSY